jgi:Zn-dependent oligopeptidase
MSADAFEAFEEVGPSHLILFGIQLPDVQDSVSDCPHPSPICAMCQVGLDKEAKVQEVGRRFRDTVLSLGGGRHPSEVYEMFRGR